jgi:transposase
VAELHPDERVRGHLQWGVAPAERQYRGEGTRAVEKGDGVDATWFVGIDWASTAHEVCVVDHEGRIVERVTVKHDAVSLQAFVDRLLTRTAGDPARVVIGIEVPRGALVELLVERGFAVYAINPKQLDRFRDRFTAAGAKDDRRDAYVIGDAVRTDRQAFRRVRLDDPRIIALREWSRIDEELGDALGRVTNQLRDLVYRMAPNLLALSPGADDPWLWALLREAPTPAAQQRLSLKRIERVLHTHRIRRVTAGEVRAVLQQPIVYTAPGVVEAVAAHIHVLLPRLELVAAQRRDAERQMARLLDTLEGDAPGDQREHSDVAIVRSVPGIGTRVAAQMLAEASQPLADRAYHVVRACMGLAPVTKQSGRRRAVSMRYACSARLREAAYHWARISLQRDPDSHAYYTRLRDRGQTHGRALRSVADRLLRFLIGALKHGQLFNPHRDRPAEA